ncbi:MAG: M3 family oligoendopeptidase [Thermodesulfovibrionales bacterium]
MKRTDRSRYAAVWNLSDLFSGDEDPRIETAKKQVERINRAFVAKWGKRTDYLNNAGALREALDDYEKLKRTAWTDGNAGYYFWLRTQVDRNNPDLKAKFNRMEEFSRNLYNSLQFFTLRLARIPRARQERFLKHPGLRPYRHFLELLFAESRYLLSEPEEKIMNLKSATSYGNWVRMTSDFLSREEREVLLEDGTRAVRTISDITSLTTSRKKRVRDTAAAAFNDIMRKNADVAEVEINSILANKKVDDELRGVARPDLPRHLSDDIETGVVDTLINAVAHRFPIARRYYALKAKLLGVKRLKYHERNVEYGSLRKTYSYDDAVRLVRRVMAGLDPEFAAILDTFVRDGRIDAFPRKGKSSGAFCVHHLITQPTFILLNHTGRLNDVMTLAHELGHGINNELIRKQQHALDFGTPTSTAEVASTFMEDFVLREVMRTADDEQKFSIMIMKLNDEVSTIFRQAACYRFERELHDSFRASGYLSKEAIGRLFRKHMSDYMGDAVEQSEGSETWWVYWSHIRMFFYVYSYAGGLLISKSLQAGVRKDPSFIAKVKEFLAAGLSDSPKRIFSRFGIDMADRRFWDQGLDEVEDLLVEAERLARKMGKLRKA